MFTRTITNFHVTVYATKKVKGQPPVIEIACDGYVTAPSLTEQQARTAMKKQGFDVPRGSYIDIEPVEQHTYGITFEQFIEIAQQLD